MASTYEIITLTRLSQLVKMDLESLVNEDGDREFPDNTLYGIITSAEELVFGDIKKTYTLSTIPTEVKSAIEKVAERDMKNTLIEFNYITGETIDVIAYYEEFLQKRVKDEKKENAPVRVYLVGEDDI